MKEQWKDIKDLEGLYQVSNWGNVMSLNYNGTGKPRLMKTVKNKYGYLVVKLFKDRKPKMFRVNRLVAETFIPNPDNLPQVNHIDENKENNRVDNLEWCTPKENSNHGTRNERRVKTQSKPVLQLTLTGDLIKEWSSVAECGRNGFNHGNVCQCCNGKRKTHKGFRFMYK